MKIELRATGGESRSHTGTLGNPFAVFKDAAAAIGDKATPDSFDSHHPEMAVGWKGQKNILQLGTWPAPYNSLRVYGAHNLLAASVGQDGKTELNWPVIRALAESGDPTNTATGIARLLVAAHTQASQCPD